MKMTQFECGKGVVVERGLKAGRLRYTVGCSLNYCALMFNKFAHQTQTRNCNVQSAFPFSEHNSVCYISDSQEGGRGETIPRNL